MRLADLAQIRENLTRRKSAAAPSIRKLGFENVPGFDDCVLEPDTGFLAVCGGTGVGKTTMLELIYLALRGRDDPLPRSIDKLLGARVTLEVVSQGKSLSLNRKEVKKGGIAAAGYQNGVSITGIEQRTRDVVDAFANQDIDALKEGGAPTILATSTLEALALICRKPYTSATYFEVETSPDVIVPFFELTTERLTYDSRQMSSGELSAFYLAWIASRAEAFGIVLIEEPEAFLPPESHRPMFGLISQIALARHLAIVLTTHSAMIASELAAKNLLSIRRVDESSRIAATREAKERVLRRLGLSPTRRAVLFVEDEMGLMLTKELVGMHQLDELVTSEIVIGKDGVTGIREMLARIPKDVLTCAFVGMVDGDQANEVKDWKVDHHVELLPFEGPAEGELLDAIRRNRPAFCAEQNRSEDDVDDALASVEGGDQHDKVKKFAAVLRLDLSAVVLCAFRLWLAVPKNRVAVTDFGKRMTALSQRMRYYPS